MVSFQCENCGDVVKKPKLDSHRGQCGPGGFACIDCSKEFYNGTWRSHTSCMTEDQKYQKTTYKEKKPKGQNYPVSTTTPMSSVPKHAYVEDVPDSPGSSFTAVAKVQVPPRAPSPPPTSSSAPVNVFDFLQPGSPTSSVSSISSGDRQDRRRAEPAPSVGLAASQVSQSGGEPLYTYGNAPIPSALQRYDSDLDVRMANARDNAGHASQTPAPIRHNMPATESMSQSDKKRKRKETEEHESLSNKHKVEGQNMLHSGLTGGLDRLLRNSNSQQEAPSPLSPKKRSKKNKDKGEEADHEALVKTKNDREIEKDDSKHRRKTEKQSIEGGKEVKTIEYSGANGTTSKAVAKVAPKTMALVKQKPEQSHSEFFLSLVDKGPESQKGQSIYGLLKNFHEGLFADADSTEAEDRKLFRGLRMKRGKHGEIILFARPEAELMDA